MYLSTININAQNGYIDVVGEYRVNGNTGFTGTGTYTTFTIEGGIITNAVVHEHVGLELIGGLLKK